MNNHGSSKIADLHERRSRLPKKLPADSAGSEEALTALESVVAEIRAQPANFPDARSVAVHPELRSAPVAELFRRHYHARPDDVLMRARLAAAKQLVLGTGMSPAKIARELNYNSDSFQDAFRSLNGLSPAAFRKLSREQGFTIQLPPRYPLGYLRRALGRDPQSVNERLEGNTYTTAIRLGDETHLLTLILSVRRVQASIDSPTAHMPGVHAMVINLLGLEQNVSEFARLAARLGLRRLIDGRPQLRISQTHTVFDGILWTIIGQQINFQFACSLRRRLIEKTGTRMANGLFAPPEPRALAALEPRDLLPLQFSRQKADYLVSIARMVTDGHLNLESLRLMSATRAERTLLAIRGLGPWSVNYLMMRSLGFLDCLPLGDTGVTSGLRALFELKQKPDSETIQRLMAQFSPFRSLATAHLWQYGRPLPD